MLSGKESKWRKKNLNRLWYKDKYNKSKIISLQCLEPSDMCVNTYINTIYKHVSYNSINLYSMKEFLKLSHCCNGIISRL